MFCFQSVFCIFLLISPYFWLKKGLFSGFFKKLSTICGVALFCSLSRSAPAFPPSRPASFRSFFYPLHISVSAGWAGLLLGVFFGFWFGLFLVFLSGFFGFWVGWFRVGFWGLLLAVLRVLFGRSAGR